MGGVKGTRYLLPIDFCNIRTQKMSKLPHANLQTILKTPVKFQKDWTKTVGGVKGTRYLLPIDFCNIRTQKMIKLKMRKKGKKTISEF